MGERNGGQTSSSGRGAARRPKTPSQVALEVTWTLKGHLKNAQIAYIRVGVLLARVRDEKLYAALHHPDMEDYAAQRLHLARASLYRYLQVHDWIWQYHKEWLEPRPKGFIPDLADVADMIWIEKELAKKNVTPAKKEKLQELLRKALAGELRKGDLGMYKRQGRRPPDQSLRAFLSKLRFLRMRGSQIAAMPEEVISELDSAIEILVNALAVERAAAALGTRGKAIMS